MVSAMTDLHGLYPQRLDRSEAMYPHDYYNGDSQPYLHNHGEGGLYVEPDYWANEVDSQLPLLSTIGRGPQGVGLYVGNTVDEDGNVSFALYSDDTHEMVWQSPNLAAAQIEFSSDDYRDIVPGEPAQLTITQKRGGTTKTDIAYIPCGTQGSLVYLLNVERERSKDDTYTATVSELTIYDQSAYPSKPTPRVNDIVYFTYRSDTEYGFAFGTIEAVEGDTVVFTARTFIAMPPVSIGANGNWYVDGKDTKVQAKGEKGDKGDKGDKGATGAKGNKGDKGDKGDAGKNAKVSVGTTTQLEPGAKATVSNSSKEEGSAVLDFGIPEGKPAKLAQVDVTNIEPGEAAYGEVEQISSNENSYRLNLGLPRGEDGKTFDVMNGVWSLEDLPEFDETPINTVYVVEDEDGTHHYYIRGRIAYDAELGGPWTIVDIQDFWALNNLPLEQTKLQFEDDDSAVYHLNARVGWVQAYGILDGEDQYGIAPDMYRYMGGIDSVVTNYNAALGTNCSAIGGQHITALTGVCNYKNSQNAWMGDAKEGSTSGYRLSGLLGDGDSITSLWASMNSTTASYLHFIGTTPGWFKLLNANMVCYTADGTNIDAYYPVSTEAEDTAVEFIDSLFEEVS